MNLDELFAGPYDLIEHAREEIEQAFRLAQGFADQRPLVQFTEIDRKTGDLVHKARLTAKLPSKIRVFIKDAAGNLRDALDHAVFASTVALTGISEPKSTGFPFAKDARGVDERLKSKALEGNATDIRPLLASLQPHENGNTLLWTLNQVRNPNTHRFIVPLVSLAQATDALIRVSQINPGSVLGRSIWDPERQEIEYLRLGPGSLSEVQFAQFVLHFVFGEVDAVRGKEVFGNVKAMANAVQDAVDGIKAETARLLGLQP
jgi:hypothetical protein